MSDQNLDKQYHMHPSFEAVSDEGSQDIFTYLGSASDYSDEPCWKSCIIYSWIWVGYSRRSLENVLRKAVYSSFLLL